MREAEHSAEGAPAGPGAGAALQRASIGAFSLAPAYAAARMRAAPGAAAGLASAIGNRAVGRVLARQLAPDAAPTTSTPARVEIPKATETAKHDWIPDPANPKNKLFGFTKVTTSGGKVPRFAVTKAPAGKGVVVEPTEARLVPIEVQYLGTGKYLDANAINFRPESGDPLYEYRRKQPGGFPYIYDVTADGSAALLAGEREHVQDYQIAFYLSLYRFAELVNEMADAGTTYASDAAARKELGKTVLIDPDKVLAYFGQLCEQTRKIRDDRHDAKPGTHTPQTKRPDSVIWHDGTKQYVAVRKLDAKALPRLGRPSWEVVMEAAATPECLKLTRLKLPAPAVGAP